MVHIFLSSYCTSTRTLFFSSHLVKISKNIQNLCTFCIRNYLKTSASPHPAIFLFILFSSPHLLSYLAYPPPPPPNPHTRTSPSYTITHTHSHTRTVTGTQLWTPKLKTEPIESVKQEK